MKVGFDGKRIFHNTTGLGNYSRDTVRILADHFSSDQFYIFNPRPSDKSFLPDHKNVSEINPEGFVNRKFSSFWRIRSINHDIKNQGIDIFHGLSNEIPFGSQNQAKTIVTIHDLIFLRYPSLYPTIDRKIYAYKFRYACENAHHIIAISEQTKSDIIEFFGIDTKKITVIYQGCHPVFQEEIKPDKRNEVIAKFNLPDKFVLNVGTIEERKNLHSLVEAIDRLENVPLVIVGKEKKYAQSVFQYINDAGMSNRVIHLKNVDISELAAIYQLASIFVYPSIFEGFGIPIVEALCSGTPVITTKDGCFQEAGGPGSMYLNNPKDVEEISNAIERIWNDSELAKSMRQQGIDYSEKFKDEHIAKKIYSLYKHLSDDI